MHKHIHLNELQHTQIYTTHRFDGLDQELHMAVLGLLRFAGRTYLAVQGLWVMTEISSMRVLAHAAPLTWAKYAGWFTANTQHRALLCSASTRSISEGLSLCHRLPVNFMKVYFKPLAIAMGWQVETCWSMQRLLLLSGSKVNGCLCRALHALTWS